MRIGCAGWAIPRGEAQRFPGAGSHLERYARVLPAVEINSSFYRGHRPQTYERWARSVPDGFQFAVKAPREITHVRRLAGTAALLRRFLEEVGALGSTLGPILVQLPPGLAFGESRARAFFDALRGLHAGPVACELRHASWFEPAAGALLEAFRVARVAADPARVPEAGRPGGWRGLVYYRLHGSASLRTLVRDATVWCIFDNTAAGAATANALTLLDRVSRG